MCPKFIDRVINVFFSSELKNLATLSNILEHPVHQYDSSCTYTFWWAMYLCLYGLIVFLRPDYGRRKVYIAL